MRSQKLIVVWYVEGKVQHLNKWLGNLTIASDRSLSLNGTRKEKGDAFIFKSALAINLT